MSWQLLGEGVPNLGMATEKAQPPWSVPSFRYGRRRKLR